MIYLVMPEGTSVHGMRDALDSAEEGPAMSAHMEMGAASEQAKRLAKIAKKPYVVTKVVTVSFHAPPPAPRGD